MSDLTIKFVEPELFGLVDEFCDSHKLTRLDPNWARVIAAFDSAIGKIVGIMVLQLIPHAEPIVIDKAYRGNGVWKEMTEILDSYLQEMANVGAIKGVYTQPTSEVSKYMAEAMGMEECEFPLFVKTYEVKE